MNTTNKSIVVSKIQADISHIKRKQPKKEKVTRMEKRDLSQKLFFIHSAGNKICTEIKFLSNPVILYMRQFDPRIVRPDKSKDMQGQIYPE